MTIKEFIRAITQPIKQAVMQPFKDGTAKEGIIKRVEGLKAAGSAFMTHKPRPELQYSITWEYPMLPEELDKYLKQELGEDYVTIWHGTPKPEEIWKQLKKHHHHLHKHEGSRKHLKKHPEYSLIVDAS